MLGAPGEAESCASPRWGAPVPSGTIPSEEMSWHMLIFTAFHGFLHVPKSQALDAASKNYQKSCCCCSKVFGEEVKWEKPGSLWRRATLLQAVLHMSHCKASSLFPSLPAISSGGQEETLVEY